MTKTKKQGTIHTGTVGQHTIVLPKTHAYIILTQLNIK